MGSSGRTKPNADLDHLYLLSVITGACWAEQSRTTTLIYSLP
jgi:hypothetical protein